MVQKRRRTMEGWRWRVVLALIGLALLACSVYFVAASRLRIERRIERDVVPIEAPSTGRIPDLRRESPQTPFFLGTV
jgi:hypothetical protein